MIFFSTLYPVFLGIFFIIFSIFFFFFGDIIHLSISSATCLYYCYLVPLCALCKDVGSLKASFAFTNKRRTTFTNKNKRLIVTNCWAEIISYSEILTWLYFLLNEKTSAEQNKKFIENHFSFYLYVFS